MADVELVIKIPEEVKQAFNRAESNELKGGYYDHGGVIGKAIKNGTPLRCVLDRIRRKMHEYTFRNERGAKYIFADRMNTIINEAESEEKE